MGRRTNKKRGGFRALDEFKGNVFLVLFKDGTQGLVQKNEQGIWDVGKRYMKEIQEVLLMDGMQFDLFGEKNLTIRGIFDSNVVDNKLVQEAVRVVKEDNERKDIEKQFDQATRSGESSIIEKLKEYRQGDEQERKATSDLQAIINYKEVTQDQRPFFRERGMAHRIFENQPVGFYAELTTKKNGVNCYLPADVLIAENKLTLSIAQQANDSTKRLKRGAIESATTSLRAAQNAAQFVGRTGSNAARFVGRKVSNAANFVNDQRKTVSREVKNYVFDRKKAFSEAFQTLRDSKFNYTDLMLIILFAVTYLRGNENLLTSEQTQPAAVAEPPAQNVQPQAQEVLAAQPPAAEPLGRKPTAVAELPAQNVQPQAQEVLAAAQPLAVSLGQKPTALPQIQKQAEQQAESQALTKREAVLRELSKSITFDNSTDDLKANDIVFITSGNGKANFGFVLNKVTEIPPFQYQIQHYDPNNTEGVYSSKDLSKVITNYPDDEDHKESSLKDLLLIYGNEFEVDNTKLENEDNVFFNGFPITDPNNVFNFRRGKIDDDYFDKGPNVTVKVNRFTNFPNVKKEFVFKLKRKGLSGGGQIKISDEYKKLAVQYLKQNNYWLKIEKVFNFTTEEIIFIQLYDQQLTDVCQALISYFTGNNDPTRFQDSEFNYFSSTVVHKNDFSFRNDNAKFNDSVRKIKTAFFNAIAADQASRMRQDRSGVNLDTELPSRVGIPAQEQEIKGKKSIFSRFKFWGGKRTLKKRKRNGTRSKRKRVRLSTHKK
jgi:hypothetical protein